MIIRYPNTPRLLVCLLICLLPLAHAQAQTAADSTRPPSALGPSQPVVTTPAPNEPAPVPREGGLSGYFDNWFNRVNEAQRSQPHWMTPIVTVTPRLEEEVRYDQFWEHLPNGGSLHNFDTGKGLELIPTTTNEVIIGAVPYQERNVRGAQTDGFADGPTILVKQRLFSENEASGDAIVTGFFSVTPSGGGGHFTQRTTVLSPSIAGGKGWGAFDIQATSGFAIPTRNMVELGTQWLTNIAFQVHVAKYFWPEFELNDDVWVSGKQRGGKNQLFLMPGIIFGRFELGGRVRAAFGVGYQFAVSPQERLAPVLDPVYDHNWILTARLSF